MTIRKHVLGLAFLSLTMAGVAATSPASAQSSSGGCAINQAANAAMQRQIALLDAAKVNPSEFFNGVNSCIGTDILKNLDLSNLIPTSMDFLGNIGQTLINTAIQKAQQQVCQVLNQQLQKVVGQINSQMGQFESMIGGQMGDLLGSNGMNTSPLTLPNIPNLGNYSLVAGMTGGGTENGISGPIFTPPPVQAGGNPVGGGTSTPVQGGSGGSAPFNPFGNVQ